jgi:glucarate dehydratase
MAYVHLAASIPNMSISIDCERTYLSDDVVTQPPVLRDGGFDVSDASGLGVEPHFDKLERYRVDRIHGAYLDASRPGWFATKPAY